MSKERNRNKKNRRLLALTVLAWTTAAFLLFVALSPGKPKNVYAVRESVVRTESFVSWDLYCWTDYGNNKIDKRYIGHFETHGTSDLGEYIKTDLCK